MITRRSATLRTIITPLLDTLVLAFVGFLELAQEIREGEMRHFDESILRVVRRPDDPARLIGPAWLGEAAMDITALGSTTVLVRADTAGST